MPAGTAERLAFSKSSAGDLPFVILNAAMTIDGKISGRNGITANISSPTDLTRVQDLRANVDAIIVGINTILSDDPLLTNRSGRGKAPIRVVVDSACRTPPSARVLSNQGNLKPLTIIACTNRAPTGIMELLRQSGAEVVPFPEKEARVDLKCLLSFLADEKGVKQVLVEGGGELNWGMLESGLVDELRVTVAPMIMGGREAKQFVSGKGASNILQAIKANLIDVKKLPISGEVLLTYKICK